MSSIEKIAQGMTQEQLINALVLTAKDAKINFKRKEKLVETEASSGVVSRARETTLVANSWKASESYNKDIEHIKIILKYIF